jgi:hypothetical protein
VNWAAGVQVTFPNVFDWASLRARKAAAAASTRAEAALYDEALLTITNQQQAATAQLNAARAIAANTPVQLAAAQQNESQSRTRYDAGLATIIEVADAQSLLAQAEVQDQLARSRRLARAAGHGDCARRHQPLRRLASATIGRPGMWLIRAALRRPITILVAVIAIALTPWFAVSRMRIDIFPDLDLPSSMWRSRMGA